jgi:hypothetical protein
LVSGILFSYVSEFTLLDKSEIGCSLQEPSEEEREETGCGEEEECAIACLAHCGEHIRNCTSNDQVEELNIVSVEFMLVLGEETNPLSCST